MSTENEAQSVDSVEFKKENTMGIRELAANIAANYAGNGNATASEVLQVLRESMEIMGGQEPISVSQIQEAEAEVQPQEPEEITPVMEPQEAVSDNNIACLVCGKRFRTLKRHLKSAHGMDEHEYKKRFGLPEDYPLVAPVLSQKRREVAKEIGLGNKKVETQNEEEETAEA